MKFSLIGSFNLADGYLGAAKALRNLGHTVDFIPAHLYRNEIGADNHHEKIIADLLEQKPDVALWWRAETLTSLQLSIIKNQCKEMKHALYSWDDPYQWEMHREMPQKCPSFDVSFTCCEGSVALYDKYGSKGVYCLPGFDPEIHYFDEDDKYKCDVSLVCTNLYEDGMWTKYPHFSRKDIVDSISEYLPDIDFRLYGSGDFEQMYPKYYRGWIGFNDSRKVFSNSKISISTHIRPDGYKYINERVCQILGCEGLLLVDYVYGLEQIFEFNKECVVFDYNFKKLNKELFANEIKKILDNYDEYLDVRKNGKKKAMNDLTWESWAKKIIEGIQ